MRRGELINCEITDGVQCVPVGWVFLRKWPLNVNTKKVDIINWTLSAFVPITIFGVVSFNNIVFSVQFRVCRAVSVHLVSVIRTGEVCVCVCVCE